MPPSRWPIRMSVGHFLDEWMIHDGGAGSLGQSHPWACSPGLYEKADWESRREQVSKQYSSTALYDSSMLQFPPPGSCLDFPPWRTMPISKINPFLSISFNHSVYCSNRKQIRSVMLMTSGYIVLCCKWLSLKCNLANDRLTCEFLCYPLA